MSIEYAWVNKCVHEIFEDQVRRTPDATAVMFGPELHTYAEINARANRIASRLRDLGARPDMLVGLCLERSVDMVCAIIGVMKAGAAYLPLDPAYPDERLHLLLEDSQAPLVVTRSELAGRLPRRGDQLLSLDSDDRLAGASSSDAPSGASPGNLAYVIYTSGSTGRPKGVLVEHRHIVRLFESTQPQFGFTASDTWTLFHSFGFDFSVWEMWGALLYGGRLILVPHDVARSPDAFYDLLASSETTVLSQTPSAFLQLSRVEEAGRKSRPMALRLIIFGGEALSPLSLRGWMDRHGDQRPRLINGYGITETTVFTTFRPITLDDLKREDYTETPIGEPIVDLSVHLLDDSGTPVRDGTPGEIVVGGAGVARGYLRRPELDQQNFVKDPFANRKDARMYRSGDLAVRRSDGLWYVGRLDEQIKVRGFRIEPGEVESHLRRHSRVIDAAVVGHDFGHGDKRLVAYIVAENGRDDGAADTTRELRSLAATSLPEHMRPSLYIALDEMPLSLNGKLDRRALRRPTPEALRPAAGDAAAPLRLEETLAGIWRQVLGVETIGLDDDFFDLGGTSVATINILLLIQEKLGHSLDMSVWAGGATLRHFTELLS